MATARILVVEDNDALQRVVKRTVEREGYSVVQAVNGAEVWQEIAKAKPDLIVLDIALPDADGRDILSKLKTEPDTADIPVVVWSGRNTDSDRRIALDLGAEDYVEKGLASELAGKIERLLLRLRQQA